MCRTTCGARKVEANALVIRPAEGRELCRQAIERYLPADAQHRYQARLERVREELRQAIASRLVGGRAMNAAIRASAWRAHQSGTLQGFFNLRLPSGLVINDLTLHEKGNRRWIGLPGKPQIEDGRHCKDPATGKQAYTPVVEIPDRGIRDKFTEQALAAVDWLLRTVGR